MSLENLFLAWREFRRGKRGKRGKRDVQEFEFNLEDNIFQLHEELSFRAYRHGPYQSFYVTDPKVRHIHKASVRDRLVHHALFRVLYPVFDRGFIFDSYSCRVGKGTHRAVNRLEKFCRKASRNNRRNIFVLKCDIKRFFDSVDHEILLRLIEQRVKDARALWLVKVILDSFEKEAGKGLPLGNVTSQLFANIYLHELDRFVKHELRERFYIRYCDDFVVIEENQDDLLALITRAEKFLGDELKLTLHPDKIFLRTYRQGIDFLGYVARPYCRTIRTRTRRRMVGRITEKNLASYLGVCSQANAYSLIGRLKSKTSYPYE